MLRIMCIRRLVLSFLLLLPALLSAGQGDISFPMQSKITPYYYNDSTIQEIEGNTVSNLQRAREHTGIDYKNSQNNSSHPGSAWFDTVLLLYTENRRTFLSSSFETSPT